MRAAGAELPNSDRAKACCHEKARQGRGCLCKTVLHYAKNRIGGICPCIPLSVASVPLFDLKQVAGMTAWNEKCGRVPILGTRQIGRAHV